MKLQIVNWIPCNSFWINFCKLNKWDSSVNWWKSLGILTGSGQGFRGPSYDPFLKLVYGDGEKMRPVTIIQPQNMSQCTISKALPLLKCVNMKWNAWNGFFISLPMGPRRYFDWRERKNVLKLLYFPTKQLLQILKIFSSKNNSRKV